MPVDELPGFEAGGPRRKIFFDPSKTRVGIVTCGGLCPGLNNVIRGLVMELTRHYGVHRISASATATRASSPATSTPSSTSTPELVRDINEDGGTILGSSRGQQDPEEIVDCLEQIGINILFVIGGDGSLHGAQQIARVVAERGLQDRDRRHPQDDRQRHPVHRSQLRLPDGVLARDGIDPRGAHRGALGARRRRAGEADGAPLGFIACYAALAKNDADSC